MFIPVSNDAKIIKIYQDLPQLYSKNKVEHFSQPTL